jgi:hypothetical protein
MDNVQRFSKDSKWVLIHVASATALILMMCGVSFAQLSAVQEQLTVQEHLLDLRLHDYKLLCTASWPQP